MCGHNTGDRFGYARSSPTPDWENHVCMDLALLLDMTLLNMLQEEVLVLRKYWKWPFTFWLNIKYIYINGRGQHSLSRILTGSKLHRFDTSWGIICPAVFSVNGKFRPAVSSLERTLSKAFSTNKSVNHWVWTQHGNMMVNISFAVEANRPYLRQYITVIVSTVEHQKSIFVRGNLYCIWIDCISQLHSVCQ